MPATGYTLYRPVRLIARPEPTVPTIRPNINGVRSSPDRVGLAPLTTCKNRGTKINTPNIDNPTMNAAPLETENTGLRNRYSGSTGSGARRSCIRNAAVSTTAATESPMIVGDPHSYSLPPHTVTSNKQVTAATSSAEPRKSIACSRRVNGSRNTELVTTSAAIPIGMLM